MATLLITLRNRKRKDNTFPVVIRIRHQNRYFDIPTGITLLKSSFDKVRGIPINNPELEIHIENLKARYYTRLRKFQSEHLEKEYSINELKNFILQKPKEEVTVREFWLENIDLLLKSNRGGSAKTYKNSLSIFSKFIDLDGQFKEVGIKQLQIIERELVFTLSGKFPIFEERQEFYTKLMIRKILVLIFLLLPLFSQSQTVCTLESRQKLAESLERIATLDTAGKSSGELAVEVGQWFIETPYVAKTLELPGEEKLVINLMGVDCTTYLESVIALVRLAQKGKSSMVEFEQELELIRYRNGRNDGYPSRLHYFSDWIYDNGEKGLFQDITAEIGGEPYPNNPTFMSENPKFYDQLADSKNLAAIKETEATIAGRSYFFIPKGELSSLEKSIQSGDIIAITTSLDNLDMVHVGFALKKNGRIHLLHASSKNEVVEISTLPLTEYLAANKSQSGIMVSRLLDTSQ